MNLNFAPPIDPQWVLESHLRVVGVRGDIVSTVPVRIREAT